MDEVDGPSFLNILHTKPIFILGRSKHVYFTMNQIERI